MKYILVPSPSSYESRDGVSPPFDLDCIGKIDSYVIGGDFPCCVKYLRDNSLCAEEYTLDIRESGISISASDGKGFFYGVQTLKQLLRQVENKRIRSLYISDKPVFQTRSVMLDISRNKVPTMETIFGLVDLWSELKINQLQLYTEHTFAYSNHKEVWKNSSPFTGEEIRSLDEYCREKGIELVPNQNSFGHMERWLKVDGYRHLADSPEGYVDPSGIYFDTPSTLDPSSREVMDFLKGLYDELLANFSSRIFNVGCDETYDLCQGRSSVRCTEEGAGRVYVDFIKKLGYEVRSRGYRMQFYGDIIIKYPELIKEIPKDSIVLDWGYESDHPFERETSLFAESGLEFYVCAGTSSWNSIAGRWTNSLENIRKAAHYGYANGASGFMITEWGDNGYWQQFPVSVPGYLAGAVAAWGGAESLDTDFTAALSVHFFKDYTLNAAKALLSMGDVYKLSNVSVHNNSVFALPMLVASYPGFRWYFPQVQKARTESALEILSEVHRQIQKSEISGEDGILLKSELHFTADLLYHGVMLTKYLSMSDTPCILGIPRKKRLALYKDLQGIISRFEKLWVSRNREGGMKDSVLLFKKLEKYYIA